MLLRKSGEDYETIFPRHLDIEEIRTALFHELRAIQDRGGHFVRGTNLYLNLVDDRGASVTLYHADGRPIEKWPVETLYRSAADELKL